MLQATNLALSLLSSGVPCVCLEQGAEVPREFEPVQGKKGVKRYTTPHLRSLVRAREEAFEMREKALGGILQVRDSYRLCLVELG